MRHNKNGRKLNRTSAHRKALNRNLTRSLILHGRIKTTLPKAKEMIPFASRIVTLAKEGSLASRRRAIQLMGESEAVGKLFTEIAPKFADRPGGYLRIVKTPFGRLGDRAEQAFVEFVEEELASIEEPVKKQKKHKKLSKKAKREQVKKERKKHDLIKQTEAKKEEDNNQETPDEKTKTEEDTDIQQEETTELPEEDSTDD